MMAEFRARSLSNYKAVSILKQRSGDLILTSSALRRVKRLASGSFAVVSMGVFRMMYEGSSLFELTPLQNKTKGAPYY